MKKKAIIVTGSVGTGKTRFSKKIARDEGRAYLNIGEFVKLKKLSEGYDRKRKCDIVDLKRLKYYLVREIVGSEKGLVIDGHLSHCVPTKYVKRCYVMTCDIKVLSKRLAKRGYSKAKIKENLQSEIFQISLLEAKKKHKVKVIDTS